MFRKILIANRGEIAVRIIRACREMGVATVAVYSKVDRKSLHVRRAHEAWPVENYLRVDGIIKAARKSGVEAIHPGYGFLAENPALPRACAEAGLVFIGPSAEAMEQMGSKTRARQTALAAGAPVVPGTERCLSSAEEAVSVAASCGYPVMLKAAAGGGGKGMRLAPDPASMPSAFRDARSEALNAFGDGELYLEKYLERPRHIEIQVLGDGHGNMIHLGERECSIQRRHQKVLEECPAPFVDAEMRRRMGETAVRIAQAAGYSNAGTLEFLVDQRKSFYFLEMNTRLQVEHPVTELVTGLDLVKLQLAVAAGLRLPIRQDDVTWRGAAIECRIYAEDPDNNFFPCPGTITALETAQGPGVRIDSGVYTGWTVPVDYDPLIFKLIGWGADRAEAISRLRRALNETLIAGIKTNVSFFRRLLDTPEFLAGDLDTSFIDRMPALTPNTQHPTPAALAALAAALYSTRNGQARMPVPQESPWKREGRLSLLRGE